MILLDGCRHRGHPKSLLPLFFLMWMMMPSTPNQTVQKVCVEIELFWVLTAIHLNENFWVITADKHAISKPLKWYYNVDRPYGFSVFILQRAPWRLLACQLWLRGVLGAHSRFRWWGAARGPAVGPVVDPTPIMVHCDTTVSSSLVPLSFNTDKWKCFLNLSFCFPTPIPKSVIKSWC